MEIALSDGRRIRLDQVATRHRHRGRAALGGAAQRQAGGRLRDLARRGASEVEVAEGVRAQLDEAEGRAPARRDHRGVQLRRPGAGELRRARCTCCIEGALLAVLVVWLFLRDWRATFVSAVALPLSIIPAFIGMYLLGFSINVVTLLALSLVVGILVDDAIVEIENIVRHLRMGKTPYQAAMEAADEIGLAVIATTFTLIAVFLPTAFMSGVAGKFFKQFGWTASLAVFVSLVVARMLTPMMAAYLLQAAEARRSASRAGCSIYMGWAAWCLQHRVLTMLGAALFFFGSFALIPLLPTGFIPPDDKSQTQVYLTLPPGSTLRADARRRRAGARDRAEASAREERLHRDRRRRRGRRPVRAARRGRSAQGHAHHPPDPAQRALGCASRGSRARSARRSTPLPGVRSKVGLGGSRREVHPGAGRRERRRRSRSTRASVERDLRTIPGLGNVTSHRQPGAPRDRGAARLRARRRPRRHQPPPSPTRCASPPRATTTRRLRQAQPVAAPGADRGEAAGRGARRTCRCSSAWRCPGARGAGDAGPGGAASRSTAARP